LFARWAFFPRGGSSPGKSCAANGSVGAIGGFPIPRRLIAVNGSFARRMGQPPQATGFICRERPRFRRAARFPGMQRL